MNKLPAKQIYMLIIIIVGIIALSVYSTYALFTYEGSTSDIISIHTPNSLTISENIYEYNQITLEADETISLDIDVYNNYTYDICYSIWYKIISKESLKNNVQVFQKTTENLTTSGILPANQNRRITLIVINDNTEKVKVNIGTIGSSKQENNCSLNLPSDKLVINSSYSSTAQLATSILQNKDEEKKEQENYLTYKNITTPITYNEFTKINISKEFKYSNETFTLIDAEELTLKEILEQKDITNESLYFCKEDNKCKILYKISSIELQESNIYQINKYDKLIGYLESTNGLRNINKTDYIYYGDNPNNFIYYNCKNKNDLSSCELWRIIGFFYDEKTSSYKTKIIRNDSIGKYSYMTNTSSLESWDNTNIYKILNEDYKFINNYELYNTKYKQLQEIIPNTNILVSEIRSKDTYDTLSVGLLNLTDYLYTSTCERIKISDYTNECIVNNWLNNIEISKEWTMTTKEQLIIQPEEESKEEQDNIISNEESNETTSEIEPIINYAYAIGTNIEEIDTTTKLDVRPVVFLKSRMILTSGDGSLENPYVIK